MSGPNPGRKSMRPILMTAALSLVVLSGCAGIEHDTAHAPDADQPPVAAQVSGTVNCAKCPVQPLELTLYAPTRFSPESFQLKLANEDMKAHDEQTFQPSTGSVFRISGGQQYPGQQLLMLVEPINQQVMLLLPLQEQGFRVLRYEGQSITGASVLKPEKVQPASS
ncbi:hypothetical protein [Kushneria phosphatilytica]|uniref:Copper resistance protein NlpE n=1 Tax=Kushneria phosphatilytica TaxID=657387 RepID=A0A5C0ZYZ5_9GAMM|nr:hypothetical protein [Kushneria phosphatilytica]QEL11074.1 hypothetical protein FY550_07990 [Kushneria phosphatilytica]